MIALRPYQLAAIEDLRRLSREGRRRLLLVAPCGAGKTLISAEMIRAAIANRRRVVMIAHRKELVDQAVDKLSRFGVAASVIMGHDRRQDDELPTQVCSIQTLSRRLGKLPPADLIIVDEAHHSTALSYRNVLDAYPSAFVIGLTATPWRTDRVGMEEIFYASTVVATPAELIDRGYLVGYECYAYDAPELHEVPLVAGEYNQKALGLAANTQVLVGGIVKEYMAHAMGRRAIVFAVNIAHSRHVVEQFNAAGVRAAHIDFKTPKDERAAIIAAFDRGDVLVLSSVSIFTEGWDCPSAEVCILARPTKSLSLFIQMIGRVLRPSPGKTRALIHDHSGDTLRHGFIDDPRDYSLTATPAHVRELQTCPLCRAVIGKPDDTGRCPKCREIIAPAAEAREPRQSAAREPVITVAGRRITADEIRALRAGGARNDLSDADAARAVAATKEQRAAEYLRLKRLQEERGFKPGFVRFAYRDTFGQLPAFTAEELDGVTPARFPFVKLPRKEKTA